MDEKFVKSMPNNNNNNNNNKNKFGDFAILRKGNSDVAVMLRDSGTNFRVSRLNRICLS